MTRTPVQDVALPGGAGTLALITLDNGFDHTRPNTFGPQGIAGLARRASTGCAPAPRPARSRPSASPASRSSSRSAPTCRACRYVTEREQALAIARPGHAAFARLRDLPVPTFAFVNGAAMGGGVELALALRPTAPSLPACPAFALPETFLGLVPGWGGCYLLPNLDRRRGRPHGHHREPVDRRTGCSRPRRSSTLGIADVLLEPADFLEDSLRWAAGVIAGARHRAAPRGRPGRGRLGAAVRRRRARSSLAKTGGRAPRRRCAPSSWSRAARTATRDEAFAAEDDALADLVMSDELRAGLYAFDLVQKRAKRPAGAPDKALARPVTKVGIVGAGLMASQLALLFARRLGVPVVMTDLDEERVDKGVGYVHAEVDELLGQAPGQPRQGQPLLKALVTGSTRKDGFADADFVIEAVFEEMAVKQQVFAEVEAVVSPECVLATNTSSLSVTEMASRPRAPRAGRRLPLLQPGRRDAAARDHPGRGDRRRRPRDGVRDRPDAGQDDDPGQGLGRPSSSTGCSAGSWARSRGSSTRAPRCDVADRRLRRAGPDAAVRPARAGRPGDRAAQQRDPARARSPTASTSRRACAAWSRPASAAST